MYTLGELANELNRQEWAVERMLKNRGYLKNNGDPRKSTIDDGLMNKNGLIKEAGWSVFIDELGYKDTDEDEEDEIEDVDIDDDDDEDIEDEEEEDEDDVDDESDDEESDIDEDEDDNDYDEDEDIDDYDEDVNGDIEPDAEMEEWYDLIYSFDVEILNDIMEMDGIYMFTIVYKKDDNIYTAYVNVETKELEDVECHGPYSKELERKVNDKLLDEWQTRFDAENPESRGEPAWVRLANARAKRNRKTSIAYKPNSVKLQCPHCWNYVNFKSNGQCPECLMFIDE